MKLTRRPVLAALASSLCLPVFAQGSAAAKRVSLMVPFPAGGPADVAARVMQPLLQRGLGETVIVENMAGVGGALGVNKVLGAPADGYTLLLATVAEPILPPLTMSGVRYHPAQLQLVSPLSYTNIALVTRPNLGIKSLDEFMRRVTDAAQAPLSYATPGSGTLYHLMTEHFKALAGAKLLHVPYKGLAPAINDLMGGQVDVAFLPLAGNTLKLIESKRLTALAVSARQDAKSAYPKMMEQRGLASFVYTVWTGVFVPQGTPANVQARVRGAIDAALQGPEFATYTHDAGGEPYARAMAADQAQAFYTAEAKRLEAIFRDVKLQVD